MRFIHMADMHFDTPFTVLNAKAGLGTIRRLEQREVFKNVIEYIKMQNIKFLFIAGDLYEHNYIRKTTIEYINELFKQIPNTKIFIAPGNHDPNLKNSYYNTFKWNENVYIFNSNIEMYEFDDVCIYGYGFDNFYCDNSKINEIKIQQKNKINILIAHASLDSSEMQELQYNPIKERELTNLGFDYVALGHIHKKSVFNNNIAYSGSTIAFGFDEPGEHGILDVELIKENNKTNNKNNLKINFIKLDKRIFEEKNINISELNSEEELIEKINSINLEKNKFYKIILEGEENFEINVSKICKLQKQENVMKIKKISHIKEDLENLSKEKSLKGIFTNEMLKLQEDNIYDEEVVKKAIELGLNALE